MTEAKGPFAEQNTTALEPTDYQKNRLIAPFSGSLAFFSKQVVYLSQEACNWTGSVVDITPFTSGAAFPFATHIPFTYIISSAHGVPCLASFPSQNSWPFVPRDLILVKRLSSYSIATIVAYNKDRDLLLLRELSAQDQPALPLATWIPEVFLGERTFGKCL